MRNWRKTQEFVSNSFGSGSVGKTATVAPDVT